MTKRTIANIAQIILVVFISGILLFFKLISPETAISALEHVPLCTTLANVLSSMTVATTGDIVEITVWTLLMEFPTAILVGITIHIVITVWNFLVWGGYKKKKPWPIVPGFIGLLLSTFIVNIIELVGNMILALVIEVLVIALLFSCIRPISKALKITNFISVKKILNFVIDGVYAIQLAAFVAAIMNVLAAKSGAGGVSFVTFIVIFGSTLLSSLIVSLVRQTQDEEEA